MFKKILLFLLIVLLLLIGIVAFNTLTAKNKQAKVEADPLPKFNVYTLEHFRSAVHFKTISYADASSWDSVPFIQFRNFIDSTYPLVHQKLQREIVDGYSYLYKWEGSDPSLEPYILMAHQDVVPIEESARKLWTVDPFAATIKNNFIWGRGTTDDKINLISILESAEKLLKENFLPKRTIYFVFGHDEEIGGKGATAIAKLLESRKVKAAMILDEGGIVTREKLIGIQKPVGLIATAEKGYLSLRLSVNIKGGHSSMPADTTAIDVLMKAVTCLREHPFKPRLVESTKDLMTFAGPELSFPNNMAFANAWLFKPLIFKNYQKSPAGNAMIRTTAVPTILTSGIKDNVVPTYATAVINFRLLPGDSIRFVTQYVKNVIDDTRVVIEPYDKNISEASPTASSSGAAYKLLDSVAKKSYPDLISAPLLLVGATDSRHFTNISDNIFKFSPMVDPIGFHGIDERVSVDSYRHSLFFFELLMRSCK